MLGPRTFSLADAHIGAHIGQDNLQCMQGDKDMDIKYILKWSAKGDMISVIIGDEERERQREDRIR